jgi:hypothetical protein
MLCRRHHTLIHTTPWRVRIHPHDGTPEYSPPRRRDQQTAERWLRQRNPRELLDTG